MWLEDFAACLELSTTLTSRVAEAIQIKEQNLPPRIYKYRCDTSYSRTCLDAETVWMASPESYNDPYDSSLRLSVDALQVLIETELANKVNQGGQRVTAQDIRKLRGRQIRNIAEDTASSFAKFRDFAKVCSFSEVYDSLLMWGHYSGPGFKPRALLSKEPIPCVLFEEVLRFAYVLGGINRPRAQRL